MVGPAAALLLAGCGPGQEGIAPDGAPRQLSGEALTFTVAGQPVALAAFEPPVPMLMLRAGPFFFWATPSTTLRSVYLQDVVDGLPAASHVLDVNAGGTVDCTYEMSWDG